MSFRRMFGRKAGEGTSARKGRCCPLRRLVRKVRPDFSDSANNEIAMVKKRSRPTMEARMQDSRDEIAEGEEKFGRPRSNAIVEAFPGLAAPRGRARANAFAIDANLARRIEVMADVLSCREEKLIEMAHVEAWRKNIGAEHSDNTSDGRFVRTCASLLVALLFAKSQKEMTDQAAIELAKSLQDPKIFNPRVT